MDWMSETWRKIQELVRCEEIKISDHGYDELAEDDILAGEVIAGVPVSEVVEEYPDFPKGPCVLLLQQDAEGSPIHVLWGIPKGAVSPAVLITAYRPDQEKWTDGFRRRRLS
jgi:hypothetical protein